MYVCMYVTMYYEDGGEVLKWWKAGEVGGKLCKDKRVGTKNASYGRWDFGSSLTPSPPHVPSSHKAIISC